jgi:heme-degrading monooxygenase HmoA
MTEAYASGNWQVTHGKEKAFVEEWTELLQWTRKTQPGLIRAKLIRHDGQPTHFISFAEWESAAARDTWKATPEFGKLHESMVEKCDDFVGGNFEEHVTI